MEEMGYDGGNLGGAVWGMLFGARVVCFVLLAFSNGVGRCCEPRPSCTGDSDGWGVALVLLVCACARRFVTAEVGSCDPR